ncbi:tail fiber assembly protein [Vreelandella janggokensis]|uniref:DUF4376 domain-containing protein n=1 Tax=Vreelandella janggokensis TaxID=370767 RepID=UPI00285DC687|nr:tail fiber assembly protein [Halomonas janggokensis]MDR5887566.1 DUF4376 domain-containing protein [Halomonas janggokensis]
MKYSQSRNSFYRDSLQKRYEAAGNWPDDLVDVTNEEWQIYGQGEPPEGMQRGADKNGRPAWVPIPPDDLDTLAAKKRGEIETALAAKLAAGMPYTMPDGTEDIIQTRPQDEPNLLGLAIEARDLRDSGETDAVQELRTQSNAVYSLTPQQMIDATDAAKAFKKAQLKKSWLLKADIDAALEAEDREALDAISW